MDFANYHARASFLAGELLIAKIERKDEIGSHTRENEFPRLFRTSERRKP
jgi:hypothetical protein